MLLLLPLLLLLMLLLKCFGSDLLLFNELRWQHHAVWGASRASRALMVCLFLVGTGLQDF